MERAGPKAFPVAAMTDLENAVPDATPAPETVTNDGEEPPAKKAKVPAKGPGMRKVQGISNRLAAASGQLQSKKDYVLKLSAKSVTGSLLKRELEALEKAKEKIAELEKVVPALEREKEKALQEAKALAAAAEQKEKEKSEKEEAVRHMSDAGACFLVELVLGKHAKKFDNTSDTVDAVAHFASKHAREAGSLQPLPSRCFDDRPVGFAAMIYDVSDTTMQAVLLLLNLRRDPPDAAPVVSLLCIMLERVEISLVMIQKRPLSSPGRCMVEEARTTS